MPDADVGAPGDRAPATLLVLLNRSSGASTPGDEGMDDRLTALFAQAGVIAEVRAIEPDEITDAARGAIGRYRAVVVAGGDGSVSAVADVLAGSETPLAVLPLGTYNHFARDLGMPVGLEAAVAALATATVRRVDVGEVNGRAFVNNASVGVYTDLVEDRDRQCRERGRGKKRAMALAVWRAARHYRRQRLTLTADGRRWDHRTSLIFVGNNGYALRFPHMTARERLDAGSLCLFAIDGHGWRLVRLALRALVGHADDDGDFRRVDDVHEIEIDCHRRRLNVAIDGEVVEMATPLAFRSRPGALGVLAPPGRAAPAQRSGVAPVRYKSEGDAR